MSARAYPGRDKARIIRRAQSIRHHHASPTNQRAHCCTTPDHVEQHHGAGLTTRCRNCGAVV
jgi:hypothetical protein